MIFIQLSDHLTAHNILCNNQWGFRTGRSTESILLKMTEQWNKALECGKIIAVLFIDFKKAFDVVPHNILLKKLQANGVSGELYELIQSYLSNRQQYTVVNGCSSKPTSVECGVPQGSLLGPQLFCSPSTSMISQTKLQKENWNCLQTTPLLSKFVIIIQMPSPQPKIYLTR